MCRCWDGIKNEIKAINGVKENYYGKDHMKVKLSSDDDLPLNKPLKNFFLSEFSSQALTIHRTAGEGRGPSHEQWDIYLELCMWDDYHVFLMATLVFTRLLVDEIDHLIELPFEWLIDEAMVVCLLDELILVFC